VIVGLQVSESTGQAQGIGRTDANAA
jgi:hypothetical protein